MFGSTIILLLISTLVYLYWFYKQKFKFFKQRDIPCIEPRWIFGNIAESIIFRKSLTDVYFEIYRKLEPHKIVGVFNFHRPTFMIRDPELLKNILVKDFSHFPNRSFGAIRENEPLTFNLVNLRDEMWRNLRIKLIPTFSNGKMKMMFPLMKTCGENLFRVLDELTPNVDIDTKDLCARFTIDVIGTCAFGIETHCLQNPQSEFRQIGREITKTRIQSLIRSFLPNIPPQFVRLFNLQYYNSKIDQFFIPLVQNTIKYREDNEITRYDFIDLLIKLKNNSNNNRVQDECDEEDVEKFLIETGNKQITSDDLKITDDLLVAQTFIFFFAGFESSSTALGFLLLELALKPEIQDEVRMEISTILENNEGRLTYDVMKKMKYVDMAIAEILRKHPPGSFISRICEKDYFIDEVNLLIKQNETLLIPIHGIHMDEKYYEKPNEFYPKHFTEEAIANRPHFSYIPFGGGPRTCIAGRFAKLLIKIGLIYFLTNFSYDVSPKMTFPIKYSGNLNLLGVGEGIWLNCRKNQLRKDV